jgi:hypothetical protein
MRQNYNSQLQPNTSKPPELKTNNTGKAILILLRWLYFYVLIRDEYAQGLYISVYAQKEANHDAIF